MHPWKSNMIWNKLVSTLHLFHSKGSSKLVWIDSSLEIRSVLVQVKTKPIRNHRNSHPVLIACIVQRNRLRSLKIQIWNSTVRNTILPCRHAPSCFNHLDFTLNETNIGPASPRNPLQWSNIDQNGSILTLFSQEIDLFRTNWAHVSTCCSLGTLRWRTPLQRRPQPSVTRHPLRPQQVEEGLNWTTQNDYKQQRVISTLTRCGQIRWIGFQPEKPTRRDHFARE